MRSIDAADVRVDAERIRRVSGVVLAGGEGRRIGRPKHSIELGGMTLLERAVGALKKVVEEVVVAPGADGETIDASALGVAAATDNYACGGAAAGIEAALVAIRRDYALVAGCDMPFLDPGVLRLVASLAGEGDVVVPRCGGFLEPLCALYSRDLRAMMAARLERGGFALRRMYDEVETIVVEFEPARAGLTFFNVNTSEDLEVARRMLALKARG